MIRIIGLCISATALIVLIVTRLIRSHRRRQEESKVAADEMEQRFREIDEYVAEGYYPWIKTLQIAGMTDEYKVLLVQNALRLVCRGTVVGISGEYGKAVVYLKEPVENDVLEETVVAQGCVVLSITESNQQVRKEPGNGHLLPVSDPHRGVVDYGD